MMKNSHREQSTHSSTTRIIDFNAAKKTELARTYSKTTLGGGAGQGIIDYIDGGNGNN